MTRKLTVGSLFSGIGGFDLGLERAGMEIRFQVEIDPFCRKVLEKHWPAVRRYEDVRTIGADLERVDVLCGGFPCQPHSLAGRRGASSDERDLWPEFARLIRTLRPRWIVAENVSGLLSSEAGRFFGRVLGDLAESGYDVEWDCLPASAFGAPHRRDRVWLVGQRVRSHGALHPDSNGEQPAAQSQSQGCAWIESAPEGFRPVLSNSSRARLAVAWSQSDGTNRRQTRGVFTPNDWWAIEPDVGRVAHGVPARVDRLKGLGNAIVPQIAEWIGRRLMEVA